MCIHNMCACVVYLKTGGKNLTCVCVVYVLCMGARFHSGQYDLLFKVECRGKINTVYVGNNFTIGLRGEEAVSFLEK